MNTFGKTTLLAGASAVALGLATTQASAFEKVDWDWYADIYEKVIIKVKIDPEFDPSGLVQVEKLQIFVGDVKANAWVEAVLHKPAAPGYETLTETEYGTVSGTFDGGFKGVTYGKVLDEEIAYMKKERHCSGSWWNRKCEDVLVPKYVNDKDDFYGLTYGHIGGTFQGEIAIERTWQVPLPFTLDQLPLVEITATAIGNAESIDSDVAVLVHEGQFVTGEGHDHVDGWDSAYNPNSHTQLAADLLHSTLHGRLHRANIEANAGSWYIQQAQADISATAVANSHSINVDAAVPDHADGVVIADLTQFAYANVSANAYLGVHYLDNYNDLGTLVDADGLRDAVTSVTATAVGNVSNITVCTVNCGN